MVLKHLVCYRNMTGGNRGITEIFQGCYMGVTTGVLQGLDRDIAGRAQKS